MENFVIELALGIVAAFLFLYRNPQRDFKFVVAAFVSGIFLTQPAFNFFPSLLPGMILWGVSAAGLLVFYSLRFKAKKEKTTIDYVKLPVLLVVVLFPWTASAWPITTEGYLLALVNHMTFYLVGTIFLYDRFILKPNPMNRKFVLILAAQTLLILVLWVYGFVQRTSAEREAEEGQRQRRISEQMKFENDQLKQQLENCR